MNFLNYTYKKDLDKMKNSEQRKIARVATELAGLAQSFKGYVAQASNPSLKYV